MKRALQDLSSEERARGFRFDGGAVGCLLLHGFTGTPAELRSLGERLAGEGYSVSAPLLPGHSTRVDDLARTRWQDWFGAALEAWDVLGRTSSTRVVAALSMGALLALHLAYERPSEVRAAALLAPALELASRRAASLAYWLARFPRLPRRVEIVRKRDRLGRLTPAYDEVPLRALASMVELQRRVRAELPSITVPTLIVEGGRDGTLAVTSASSVEAGLGSALKRRVRFAESGHIVTEGDGADAVIDEVASFFAAMVRPLS
ncbi:MAG: alpha/beta hydrolase [Candidatus Binatia bacterium]